MSETVPSALLLRENYAPADASAPDRVISPVRTLLRRAAFVMIAVMILLPAVQVVLRELLGRPFVGAEELTRFMLICVVFVTFPYVVASGTNIRLEEGLNLMPPAVRRVFNVLITATSALTLAIAAASVATATLRNLQNSTPTLGIPYYIFFSAAFFGLLFSAVECGVQLWKTLTHRPPYVVFADETSPDDMDALEAALIAEMNRGAGESFR